MTVLELKALRNFHLTGTFGFPFSALKKHERAAYILKWQQEGLIDLKKPGLTTKGIEATLPGLKPNK